MILFNPPKSHVRKPIFISTNAETEAMKNEVRYSGLRCQYGTEPRYHINIQEILAKGGRLDSINSVVYKETSTSSGSVDS